MVSILDLEDGLLPFSLVDPDQAGLGVGRLACSLIYLPRRGIDRAQNLVNPNGWRFILRIALCHRQCCRLSVCNMNGSDSVGMRKLNLPRGSLPLHRHVTEFVHCASGYSGYGSMSLESLG
jgi:hypothetical protein